MLRCGSGYSGQVLSDYTQKIRSAMCCSVLAVRSLGSSDSAQTYVQTREAAQREPLLAIAGLAVSLTVMLTAFLLGWERKAFPECVIVTL